MYSTGHALLKRRLLTVLTACLLLPLALTGQVGKAAPAGQIPSPTPSPTPGKPILLTDPVPDAQQGGVMYFSQTGHTLRGKFLDYWEQNGGLSQFGYPLTEEFFEPDGPDNSFLRVPPSPFTGGRSNKNTPVSRSGPSSPTSRNAPLRT